MVYVLRAGLLVELAGGACWHLSARLRLRGPLELEPARAASYGASVRGLGWQGELERFLS